MEYKLLDPFKDKVLWDKFAPGDLYYSSGFAILSAINFGNTPQAFFYGDDNNYVFFPFVRRLINSLPFFESGDLWFDIISPEYGGAYVRGDPMIIHPFLEAFHEWCARERIVAEYIRCHPTVGTAMWYSQAEKVKDIIYIDLRPSADDIFNLFVKKCRQSCRNAEKRGVTVRETRSKEDIEEFHHVYTKTMERRNAHEYSFIRPDIFKNILWFLKNNSKLYVAEHSGRMLVGSVVLFKNGVAWDYFRGSDIDTQNLRPSNAIVWKIAQDMKNIGCHTFVLGAGFSPRDGVEVFKRTFSDKTYPFHIYKKIHNQEMYDRLVELRKKCGPINNPNFFPAYRADFS